ncbi:unnamed protein product [Wuchereria bancrofti]|uniref:Uncharacterized protein n=2 Tax=Wuchereria bancrofti TaxID=6293 RepID=A0A3P7ETP9_WUCBA|nr:unnamed protein product [Wuchereria bancrofti]
MKAAFENKQQDSYGVPPTVTQPGIPSSGRLNCYKLNEANNAPSQRYTTPPLSTRTSVMCCYRNCYHPRTHRRNKKFEEAHITMDNCKSEKLRELVLETIGLFPHQYSYQARYMKEQAEIRFGNWWSAVIIGDRGGYGMSAVYDQYANTRIRNVIFLPK